MKKSNDRKIRRILSLGLTLVMVFSMSTIAVAAGPMNNGEQPNMSQQGTMGQQNGLPQSGNMGQPNEAPMVGNPDEPTDADVDREDMMPPEDPNAEPNENVPTKPDNDNQLTARSDVPQGTPMQEPNELKGVNLKAIESYLEEAGEEADENVEAAYNALSEALASEPDGTTTETDTIESLETALQEALDNAQIDISAYETEPEAMAGDSSDALEIQNGEQNNVPNKPEDGNTDSETNEFMQFVMKYWNKLKALFQD